MTQKPRPFIPDICVTVKKASQGGQAWKFVKAIDVQKAVPHVPAKTFAATYPNGKVSRHPAQGYRKLADPEVVFPFMEKLERSLNGGLMASEAERAFPRIGQHHRLVYRVTIRRDGNPL